MEAGLNRMRNELHTAMTMAPNTFGGGEQVDDRFPTHDYMAQKHPRDDLPPYTTWLKHLVNECTRHKAEHRLDAIDLVEELENHLHDMFLVKDARFLPHDTLRRRNDPFLPDRIWNVNRRRRGQNN
ncbi:hypothetical protein SLS60_002458 [Paraconiothyrium brasiliense]|uniref:Uncharacterized protein n=1 Tax=Paraconiothyrium brasiliense TaxID=300254 RepID=A0ABR3S274_9PLEO